MNNAANAPNHIRIVGDAPQWDLELQEWMSGWLKRHPGIKLDRVCSSQYLGAHGAISPATLKSYVDGKYFVAKEDGGLGVAWKSENRIETTIREFRAAQEKNLYLGYAKEFIETKTWRQIQYCCTRAITENAIIAVYGKYGIGKTRSLREFADRNLTTQPVHILCSPLVSIGSLLTQIAEQLRLSPREMRLRGDGLLRALAGRLQRTRRPLFIDQANYLKKREMGALCYLWEISKTPIVMMGTPNLFHTLTQIRDGDDEIGQIASRVLMQVPLAELSREEILEIVKVALPSFTEKDADEVFALTRGNHRHLDMGMPDLIRLWEKFGDEIHDGRRARKEVIGAAFSRLMVG